MKITVNEASTLTGHSVEKIRHWCREKWLKKTRKAGPRVWLVDRDEVVNFKPPTRGWPKGKKRGG